jgi:hypothetical protein
MNCRIGTFVITLCWNLPFLAAQGQKAEDGLVDWRSQPHEIAEHNCI